MKVGDYVRTDTGRIAKIYKIIDFNKENQKPYLNFRNMLVYTNNENNVAGKRGEIIKSSPNIIDLIEVGDYVNGCLVLDIAEAPKKALYLLEKDNKCALIPRLNEDIYSIVTKEQFESMEYRIGEWK